MRQRSAAIPSLRFGWVLGVLAVPALQKDAGLRVLDLDGLAPAARLEVQRTRREAFLESAREQLASGCRTQRDHETTVFHHGAGQFAKDLAADLEWRRAWLADVWPFPGEVYLAPPLVYLGADEAEVEATRAACGHDDTFDGVSWSRDVPTSSGQKSNRFQFFGPNPTSQSGEIPRIQRAAGEYWLFSADRHLAWAMPTWMYWSLVEGANRYERKGKRIQLNSYWNWGMADVVKRSPSAIRHDWSVGDAPPFELRAAQLWIAFFRDGPGARKKSWQGLLGTYAANVAGAVRDEEKRNPPAAVPPDRRQEAALLATERKTWEALRGPIAKRAFEATFAAWTDDDFAALDAAFVEFLSAD